MLKNGVTVMDLFERDSDSEFRYEEVDGGIRIVAYTGSRLFLIVPEEIDGKPVVEIGLDRNYCSIRPVVYLPKTISRFDPDFSPLAEDRHTEMWFSNAYMDEANPWFKVVDSVLYSADMSVLYLCLNGEISSYAMPASVTTVKRGAFRTFLKHYCTLKLDNVSFSENLTTIEDYAFFRIGGGKVVLPESVRQIGLHAFAEDVEVIAPGYETLGGLPGGVLRRAPLAERVYGEKGEILYSTDKKTVYGFMKRGYSDALEALAFEAPTERIEAHAFKGWPISKLDLGPTVRIIGSKAFDAAKSKPFVSPPRLKRSRTMPSDLKSAIL